MNATAATSDPQALPLTEPEEAQEPALLSLPSGSVGLARRTSSAVRETRKYTVLLDDAADTAFDRLVRYAADGYGGRIRSNTTRRGRQVGRSDIVRALLFLADSNLELRDVMVKQIEAMFSEQEGPTT